MRKRRATTAKRRTTKRTTRTRKSNPILVFDIIGVALIFLCPISLYALRCGDSSGFLGRYIAATLRVSVGGIGAYELSLLLALLGAILIVGPLKIIPRNISIGSAILFLVTVAWASLSAGPAAWEAPGAGGGALGRMFAGMLRTLAGDTISYILLVFLTVAAVIIIVDVPVANLIHIIRTAWLDWKEAAAERAALLTEARGKDKPAKGKAEELTESRKRTLAGIFGRGSNVQDETGSDGAVAIGSAKTPVKINGGMFNKPERGKSEPAVSTLEPAEQSEEQR